MRFQLSVLLIFSILSFSIQASTVELKMLPTMEVVNEDVVNTDKLAIEAFLSNEQVQQELIKQGVSPQEALDRVATLSAKELKVLSEQIHTAKAGGDFGVGSVLGLAVLVFLVLLLTDIAGYTKVFPFTRSAR